MKSTLNSDLIYEVLSVVEEIPEGRVATYGQIARLTGRDRNARLIGRILSMSAYYGQYPDVSGMITDECGISFLTGIIIQSF